MGLEQEICIKNDKNKLFPFNRETDFVIVDPQCICICVC